MSLFYALTLGTKAMAAQQNAMEIAGHNIANLNTQGYSRQRVTMVASQPQTFSTSAGSFQVGTGVEIANISRVHDDFMDAQLQAETHDAGLYDATYNNYKIIETTFNEPSDSGTATALDEFWQSWQKLASPNPGDKATREEVKVKSVKLADSLKNTYNSLVELQSTIDSNIQTKVNDINTIIKKIAGVNNQIANVPPSTEPNDLMDTRDQLLLDLAKHTNFSSNIQANRTVDISISGIPLVVDNHAYELSSQRSSTAAFNSIKDVSNQDVTKYFTSGEMAGLIHMRDNVLEEYKGNLNTIASTIINRVNDVHKSGYDMSGNPGSNFFTGTDANSIAVSTSIQNNVNYIAAASSKNNITGNGEIAKAIGDIQNEKSFDNSSANAAEYYQNIISRQANDANYTQKLMESQQNLIKGLNERKASISGVSVDEEMTGLVQYEQSYAAAAKYVSVINQTIEAMMAMIP